MLLFCLAKDCEGTLFDGGEDRRTMMLGSSSSSSSSHAMVLSCVSPLSSPAVIYYKRKSRPNSAVLLQVVRPVEKADRWSRLGVDAERAGYDHIGAGGEDGGSD